MDPSVEPCYSRGKAGLNYSASPATGNHYQDWLRLVINDPGAVPLSPERDAVCAAQQAIASGLFASMAESPGSGRSAMIWTTTALLLPDDAIISVDGDRRAEFEEPLPAW